MTKAILSIKKEDENKPVKRLIASVHFEHKEKVELVYTCSNQGQTWVAGKNPEYMELFGISENQENAIKAYLDDMVDTYVNGSQHKGGELRSFLKTSIDCTLDKELTFK